MNKIYLTIIKYLKKLTLSVMKYYNSFLQRKKTIDNMYTNIIQNKRKEVKNLENKLNNIHHKNIQLEKELLNMRDTINKKNNLIKNLQDLVTRRLE